MCDDAFCHWDVILNETYRKATKQCPYDTDEACAAYVGRLREAERAWLRYRDATVAFLSQKMGGTYDRVEASVFAAEATRSGLASCFRMRLRPKGLRPLTMLQKK